MENYKSTPLKVITEELQITDAPIKALVKKGFISEKYVEVYRNPYDDDDFEQTKPFPLTEEQNKLLHRFYHQLQMKLIIHFTIWCYRKWKDRSIFTIYSSSAQERKKKLSFLFLKLH